MRKTAELLPEHLRQKIRGIAMTPELEPPPETEAARAMRHLRECGLPERSVRYLERTGLELLRHRPSAKALEAFMADPDKSVAILQGGVGSGKTTLCALAFLAATYPKLADYDPDTRREVYRDDYDASRCFFFDGDDLWRFHEEWSDHQATIRRLEAVPILVLDDMATTDVETPKVLKLIQSIFKKRDGACLKTVVTTNATADELRERYRERVADRLKPGSAVVISCGDESLRT